MVQTGLALRPHGKHMTKVQAVAPPFLVVLHLWIHSGKMHMPCKEWGENLFYPFASSEEWQFSAWCMCLGLSMFTIDSLLSLNISGHQLLVSVIYITIGLVEIMLQPFRISFLKVEQY
ncbi:hypothetical protein EDD15DRAFT_2192608 [Pisolithus albus]|nr:hypothetical protein EDD15DRAFT_2192608 [Pisolithus albus]